MSESKRTYASEVLGNKPLKLQPVSEGNDRAKKRGRIAHADWKLPCSVDTIYRLIERIQEL